MLDEVLITIYNKAGGGTCFIILNIISFYLLPFTFYFYRFWITVHFFISSAFGVAPTNYLVFQNIGNASYVSNDSHCYMVVNSDKAGKDFFLCSVII